MAIDTGLDTSSAAPPSPASGAPPSPAGQPVALPVVERNLLGDGGRDAQADARHVGEAGKGEAGRGEAGAYSAEDYKFTMPQGIDAQDPAVSVPAYIGASVIGYAPDVHGFDFTLGARNLFGREEVPAQSDYNRTNPRVEVLRVPGPGREVFMRMGYKF